MKLFVATGTAMKWPCSHVCGLLFYLSAHAAFLREEAETGRAASPASVKRQWGLPKRKIAPDTPIHRLNFRKIREGEPFCPIANATTAVDPRPPALRSVKCEDVEQLVEGLKTLAHSPSDC